MNSFQANLCLLCVTLCWSTEVIIFSVIPDSVSPFATTCITSLVGALLIFLIFRKRIIDEVSGNPKKILLRCLLLGIMNCAYNLLYLFGLKYFDVSSGAFTFSMTAVVIPVILLTMRQKVDLKTWLSAGFVFIGILLAIAPTASVGQTMGIIFVGLGCIIRAVYIVILNKYANENDPVTLSSLLSGIVSILSVGLWFAFDPSGFGKIPWNDQIIASLAIYSFVIVAFAQTLNIFAQKKSTPANATIIYSTEIIFSTIWGVMLPASMIDKTPLTLWIILGVVMVVIGNLITIIPSHRELQDES
jgi:drug/metabolite transporter (DMT)-like permease